MQHGGRDMVGGISSATGATLSGLSVCLSVSQQLLCVYVGVQCRQGREWEQGAHFAVRAKNRVRLRIAWPRPAPDEKEPTGDALPHGLCLFSVYLREGWPGVTRPGGMPGISTAMTPGFFQGRVTEHQKQLSAATIKRKYKIIAFPISHSLSTIVCCGHISNGCIYIYSTVQKS